MSSNNFFKDLTGNKFVDELKKTTPCRIGIGHAGGRYTTKAQLKFREDLAVSKDAVHRDVPAQLVSSMGLLSVQSRVRNRAEYLMNTTAGRFLNEESVTTLKAEGTPNADVQLLVSDGLSSEAFERNVPEMLPLVTARLKEAGLTLAVPIFIRWARVAVIDHVGEILKPKTSLILLGERPGLGVSDSLSGYFEYMPGASRLESDRNVLSNIHRRGVPPTEAALMLAEALIKILDIKMSGMTVRFDFV